MESRLDQAALAAMKLAFTGEQTFSEQDLRAFQKTALGEICLIGDQDVFDPIGLGDQVHVLGAQTKMNQVAVIAREALQKLRCIPPKLREHAENGKSFTQRRAGNHASSLLLLLLLLKVDQFCIRRWFPLGWGVQIRFRRRRGVGGGYAHGYLQLARSFAFENAAGWRNI